jgi:hypothetical protein
VRYRSWPGVTGQIGFQVLRANTVDDTGLIVDWNEVEVGGGSRSMVVNRLFTSAGGVLRTTPNPSGRRGSGVDPTIQGDSGRGTAAMVTGALAGELAGAREVDAGVRGTAWTC